MKTHTSNRLFKLLGYSAEHKPAIVVASIYSVINKFFDIFPEILIGIAIDVVIEQEDSFLAKTGITDPVQQLILLAVLTLLVWLLESLSEYCANVRWRNIAQEIQHKLRIHGVNHLQQLSLAWYERQNSGQLLAILNDDVNQVERFLNEGLHNLLQLFVSSLLIGAVFFYFSPIVACLAILPIPIILMGGFKLRAPLTGHYAKVRSMAAQLGGYLSGVIQGVITIRASVAEKACVAKVEQASQSYISANQKAIKLSSAFVPIIRMAVLAGFLVTLVIGGLQTLEGDMSPAVFTVLVFLTQRLLWPFTRFGDLLDLYERSMASAKRVFDLIDHPLEVQNTEQPVAMPTLQTGIIFDKVCFGYAPKSPVLNNFNLHIKSGEFIGIVGPTGSGKSTLMKLLLRFYDVNSGSINIDNHAIQAIDMAELRRSIGYVGQDSFLLDASIRDNLLMGKTQVSDKAIEKALFMANAAEFVSQLPQGLDTLVGERGQTLSGGQRQRLTIARGILNNPPILIFDEATSAVDNETEEAIQRSIRQLAKDHTMLVIAHRLSTIRHANRIVVLEKGHVTQIGSHETLSAQSGLYQRLWKLQTGETDAG